MDRQTVCLPVYLNTTFRVRSKGRGARARLSCVLHVQRLYPDAGAFSEPQVITRRSSLITHCIVIVEPPPSKSPSSLYPASRHSEPAYSIAEIDTETLQGTSCPRMSLPSKCVATLAVYCSTPENAAHPLCGPCHRDSCTCKA